MKERPDLEAGKWHPNVTHSKHNSDLLLPQRPQHVPLQFLSTIVRPHLPDQFYMAVWIALSCSITLFNKWLMAGQFAYRMKFKLVFTSIMTRLLFAEKSIHLKKIREIVFLKQMLVMAVLFSLALTSGNSANLYLSVPSMQMLKSLNPVVLLAALWLLGIKTPDWKTLASSALIVFGAASAYFGTVNINQIGLLLMAIAIGTHNARMVMTQKMIKNLGEQENPAIMTLCYFAPLGALMVGAAAFVLELPRLSMLDFHKVGFLQLTINAALAFLLNLSSFDLIGRTSPFTLSICAVVRDVILIAASSVIWKQPLTTIQLFGYGVVLLGLVVGTLRKS